MRDTGVMNTGTPPRAADGARLGTALTRRAVIDAATQAYLRGEAVDMSALAAQLGIGRSTLYRLVGNRDDLLEVVLAEATERTFRRAAAGATAEGGVDLVLDVINRFMHAVIDAEPLQALCKREPLVFIRLALLPGTVEQIAAKLIAEMLQTEVTAGARSIATRHHAQPSHRPNVRRPPLRPPARWDRARDRHRPRPRCRAPQSPQQAARARLRPDPLPRHNAAIRLAQADQIGACQGGGAE